MEQRDGKSALHEWLDFADINMHGHHFANRTNALIPAITARALATT
jgi:hypothetical protein